MATYKRNAYKKVTRQCKQCHSSFEGGSKAEYCSNKCKQKFHNDKKKEEVMINKIFEWNIDLCNKIINVTELNKEYEIKNEFLSYDIVVNGKIICSRNTKFYFIASTKKEMEDNLYDIAIKYFENWETKMFFDNMNEHFDQFFQRSSAIIKGLD